MISQGTNAARGWQSAATVLLFVLAIPHFAEALQKGSIVRVGTFETITNVGDNRIDRFVMSADGSAALYLLTEAAADPRGCTSRQQLRRVETASKVDTVIEQGFTFDTGVGQGCASSLWGSHFDVSDDGTDIAYVRVVEVPDPMNPTNPFELPELVHCDFNTTSQTCTKTVLLATLPHINYGNPFTLRIDPAGFGSFVGGDGAVVLSGDGNFVFFRNSWGPCANPKINPALLDCFTAGGQDGYSGPTIYRVSAPGGAVAAILEAGDMSLISGVHPDVSGQVDLHDVDRTGATLVLPISVPYCCIGYWTDLVVMSPSSGLASARSVAKNTDCCGPANPQISANGRTVAFARRPSSSPPLTGGIHVLQLNSDLSPAGAAAAVNPQWSAVRPCLAADGSAVGSFDNENSEGRVQWAAANGDRVLAISKPTVVAVDDDCRMRNDGGALLLYGTIRTNGLDLTDLPRELLLYRWQQTSGAPTILGAQAEPAVWMAEELGLQAWMFATFFWNVSFTAPGHQVERVYSAAFDGRGRRNYEVVGWKDWYGFFDDGIPPDQFVGDGIFTESDLWVTDDYPSTDPAFPFPDIPPTLRVGVAASNGTAAHADVLLDIYPPADENSQNAFGVGDSPPTILGADGVPGIDPGITLDFSAHDAFGWITARRFSYAPPGAVGSIPAFWQLFGGEPQARGGPGLGNYSAVATFEYDPADVAAAGLLENRLTLWHSSDSVAWSEVPSIVNSAANTVTAATDQTDLDGFWTLGGGTPVAGSFIFADGFESGNTSRW